MKNQFKDFKIMKIADKLYKISYFFTNEVHQYVLPSEVDEYIYTKLQKKVLLPHSPYTVSYDSMTWFAISIIFEDKEYKLNQEVFNKSVSNMIDDNKEDIFFYEVMRDILFHKYHFHFHSYQPIHSDKCNFFLYHTESDSRVVDLTQVFYQMNFEEKKNKENLK